MKISYNWLKELVDFDLDPVALGHKLTLIGTAVESVEPVAGNLDNVVVGKIVAAEPSPQSEKITICKVELGKDIQLTVVCGAPNVKVGMKSALALPGAMLSNDLKVQSVVKYGVTSEGMLCSLAELGISDDHSGIMEIDTSIKSGTDLKTALNLDDYALGFELTPNRPDCLSAIGIAREISALVRGPIKRPTFEIKESADKASDQVSIELEYPTGCPRYAARVIKGVRIGASPWWLKQRLMASGIRSINNVVDITNYVMLEYGHPLHAFDYDNFSAPKVLVRRAAEGEIFKTLDGVDRKLNQDVLLITDGNKPVAIAGIMGGEFSEVTGKTTNVLLESAYFDPSTIRRGRKFIGLQSESQVRFERGADPNIVPIALDRAASLLEKYAGGKVSAGIVDAYPEKFVPVKLELRPSRVNQILATDLSAPTMIDILNSLELKVNPGKNMTVEIPTFRPDINREIDIIEEIARIFGYEKIPVRMNGGGKLGAKREPHGLFAAKVRQALAGQGYNEVFTNSLVDPKQVRSVDPEALYVEVLNPISEDLKWMRPSLTTCLLNVVRENVAHQVRSVKIFEIGTVFANNPGSMPIERQSLAFAISGSDSGESWAFHPGEFNFFDIKGALQVIEQLTNSAIVYDKTSTPVYGKDCSFSLAINETQIGSCGKIGSALAKEFGIKPAVFYAEIDLSVLESFKRAMNNYIALPRFPMSERDIAVVIEEGVKCQELLDTIKASADQTLKETIVFDLYKGKQVEAGKKSLAFRLVFQDESKTLTDGEIDAVYNQIVLALKNKHGATLRA